MTSNAGDLELLVNGKSLGHAKPVDRYLFTFADVAWEPGEIQAIAYNAGKPVARESKRTARPPVALKMSVITGPGGMHADGSDIALIDVEAADARGARTVPRALPVHRQARALGGRKRKPLPAHPETNRGTLAIL